MKRIELELEPRLVLDTVLRLKKEIFSGLHPSVAELIWAIVHPSSSCAASVAASSATSCGKLGAIIKLSLGIAFG